MARRSATAAAFSRAVVALLLLAAAAQVACYFQLTFVAGGWSPSTSPVIAARDRQLVVARRAEAEAATETEEEVEEGEEEPEPEFQRFVADRGIDLDGDKLDNLNEFYEEGIKGKGGMPKGFMKDLLLRSFFGTWNSKGYLKMSRDYTGPNKRPCEGDYKTAYEELKSCAKEGKHILGKDDGEGWVWLVAGQNPGGLYLYLMKSPPYGERPLALIKQNNVDEFFNNVDWHRLFVRLHKWQLWGGTAKKFPYPTKR